VKEAVREELTEHVGLMMYHQEMYDLLRADVEACEAALKKEDAPHLRRELVRTVYALFEASTFYLKRIAVTTARGGGLKLNREATAALLDESYGVKSDGSPYSRRAKIPTLSNIKLSLGALAICAQASYAPSYDDGGWAALCTGLEVRDRLTHPKSLSDLEVLEEELGQVRRAVRWYHDTLTASFKAAADAALARYNEIVSKAKKEDEGGEKGPEVPS
jgi:hypothetical protein